MKNTFHYMNVHRLTPYISRNLVILFMICMFVGCRSSQTTPQTVDSVMDDVVTRLYNELDESQLDTLSHTFIEQFISPTEREVLATAYWQFEVNVPSMVSLMRDTAQQTIPFWLAESSFQKTDMIVSNGFSTYEVWQAEFPEGKVELGINGFDRHRPVYFVSVGVMNPGDELSITPVFPQNQHMHAMDVGSFTYHDWDGLILTEVPEPIKGHTLLTTIRGRAREAHMVGGFRTTDFPASLQPDQITLTLADQPQNRLTVQWRTNSTIADSWVKYWTLGSADTTIVSASYLRLEDRQLRNDRYVSRFTAQLNDLTPATTYQYVVEHDRAKSDEYTFKTAGEEEEFSFIWLGDTHNDAQTGSLIQGAAQNHPESSFFIQTGDVVNTGLYRNDWDDLFGTIGSTFAQKPFMAVPGNHDSQDGLGASMYRQHLHYPSNGPSELTPGFTYAFQYQNALFLMLDIVSFSAAEQKQWIADQLESTDAIWKFVVFHFPPYTNQEPYVEIENDWVPLFDQYGVDIVMNGHFHYYLRTQPMKKGRVASDGNTGTTYIMSVGTDSKNRDIAVEPYAAKRENQGYLYQYVQIVGEKLLHTSLDAKGNVIDSFELKK